MNGFLHYANHVMNESVDKLPTIKEAVERGEINEESVRNDIAYVKRSFQCLHSTMDLLKVITNLDVQVC